VRLSREFGQRFLLAPPLPGRFRTLGRERAAVLVGRLRETRFPGKNLEVEAVRVLALPFYPGWLLLDVQARPMQGEDAGPGAFEHAGVHSFLYGPDGFTPLDGTSLPIFSHNDRHGIALSDPAWRELYMRFFCAFVRGSDGPFEVVDDTSICGPSPDAEPSPPYRVTPPERCESSDPDAVDAFSAVVLYGDRLYAVVLRLNAAGHVDMDEDTPISGPLRRIPPLAYQHTMRFLVPATALE
jgi:hypothetical protein